MRLVMASAKNHSRIRPSDSASAITTARVERLGRLAGHVVNIGVAPQCPSPSSGARFWMSDAFMQRERLGRSPFLKCQLETSMAETSKSRTKKKAAKTKNETHKEQEKLLNRELEDSFPASDPLSLTQPTTEMGGPDRKRHKAK
jgi:hypothetical protein